MGGKRINEQTGRTQDGECLPDRDWWVYVRSVGHVVIVVITLSYSRPTLHSHCYAAR